MKNLVRYNRGGLLEIAHSFAVQTKCSRASFTEGGCRVQYAQLHCIALQLPLRHDGSFNAEMICVRYL